MVGKQCWSCVVLHVIRRVSHPGPEVSIRTLGSGIQQARTHRCREEASPQSTAMAVLELEDLDLVGTPNSEDRLRGLELTGASATGTHKRSTARSMARARHRGPPPVRKGPSKAFESVVPVLRKLMEEAPIA